MRKERMRLTPVSALRSAMNKTASACHLAAPVSPSCLFVILIFSLWANATLARSIPGEEAHTASILARGGPILPTPQRAAYASEEPWTVKQDGIVLVLPPTADAQNRVAAEELASRIGSLFEGGAEVEIVDKPDLSGHKLCLILGTLRGMSASIQDASPSLMPPEYPGREGYVIRCLPELRWVVCAGMDVRGACYAAQSVIQLFSRKDQTVRFHPAEVDDWPAFDLRSASTTGWREVLTGDNYEEALRSSRWLGACKFNTLSINHSTRGAEAWRDPPDDYAAFVTTLAPWAAERGLEVMSFINPFVGGKDAGSPGSKIVISRLEDRDQLEAVVRLSVDYGARSVMLCMGDYAPGPWPPYELSNEDDISAYDGLPEAAAFLANDLSERLNRHYGSVKLHVCPPWYSTEMVDRMAEAAPEARRLSGLLPGGAALAWTGPAVRSTSITERDLERWRELTGAGKPILWDNTFSLRLRNGAPAGDYVLCDRFETRYPPGFEKQVLGVHFNNGFHGEIANIGLLDLANRLWNPAAYDPEQSRRLCVERIAGPGTLPAIDAFRELFYELLFLDMTKDDSSGKLRDGLPRLKERLDAVLEAADNPRLKAGFQREYDAMARRFQGDMPK